MRANFEPDGNREGQLQSLSNAPVSEAQAQLPMLLKRAEKVLIVITRRDKTVAYLVFAQRMEALSFAV
jgi:PHD/YefM family antitoxin component YafN of YafNO toxin-antitoxin module